MTNWVLKSFWDFVFHLSFGMNSLRIRLTIFGTIFTVDFRTYISFIESFTLSFFVKNYLFTILFLATVIWLWFKQCKPVTRYSSAVTLDSSYFVRPSARSSLHTSFYSKWDIFKILRSLRILIETSLLTFNKNFFSPSFLCQCFSF